MRSENNNAGTNGSDARAGGAKLAVSSSSLRQTKTSFPRSYDEWRKLAVDLARLSPAETLATLERDDPFGVRGLAKILKEQESLDFAAIEKLFPCPPLDQRLSFPDQRNNTKARDFRENRDASGTFLFFQHLRKAGGTHFCTLAQANMAKPEIPQYFCMPDYYWHHDYEKEKSGQKTNGCAGCLHHWSNQEITSNMKSHRIAGNEWDSFDPSRHLDLPAVFVTSFRRPLARAVSQFRFECLENRGCHFTEIEPWW